MKQTLNGKWSMRKVGHSQAYPANVPVNMYQVLYENGVIEDPFFGENDQIYRSLSDDDYEFYRDFEMDEAMLAHEKVEIEFLGLDTLATVYINEEPVLETNNMHRTYRLNIKSYLKFGTNHIRVYFASPNQFIAKEYAKDPLWGVSSTMAGYGHLRKGHHMFGWDWGPQLPDMGIWRDVNLYGISLGRLEDVYVIQNHLEDQVNLKIQISGKELAEGTEIKVSLMDKDGGLVLAAKALSMSDFEKRGLISVVYDKEEDLYLAKMEVKNPKLWWPNGYGDQYLYGLKVELVADGEVIDTIEKRIGLRTMTVTKEKDPWGESFDYTVNGVRIFAMGADYIPEDALITRPTYETTKRLIKDCARANYNALRVWGGGIYPSDDLFDLCDEYGLIIWEDFMFACGVYRLTDAFKANITAEFIDNIRRLRHHPSLGLWCGNNEMEWGFVEWGLPKDERLRMDYLLMYEKLIPDVLAVYDPQTFYWPASPSSGGGFEGPNDDNKGDVHYWQVFHGGEHYKKYRDHYFKFASEYGMQAFPDMKTIRSYASDDQMNAFSPTMENHNKCTDPLNGNIKILLNMAGEFKLPSAFEDQVYISQLFQGEAIKCAVEHFRRNRGRCMGSTYWQVNDNYPVASWASIDFYGRWKGMHYYARRFYEPLLLSAYEEGFTGHIHFTNDTLYDFRGKCKWQIRHIEKGILLEGQEAIQSKALSAMHIKDVHIDEFVESYGGERQIYLTYQLLDQEDRELASESILFCFHKYFQFKPVELSLEVRKEDKWILSISSDGFAKSVAVDFDQSDCVLSKNYMDILPGQTIDLVIEEWYSEEAQDVSDLLSQIRLSTVGNLDY